MLSALWSGISSIGAATAGPRLLASARDVPRLPQWAQEDERVCATAGAQRTGACAGKRPHIHLVPRLRRGAERRGAAHKSAIHVRLPRLTPSSLAIAQVASSPNTRMLAALKANRMEGAAREAERQRQRISAAVASASCCAAEEISVFVQPQRLGRLLRVVGPPGLREGRHLACLVRPPGPRRGSESGGSRSMILTQAGSMERRKAAEIAREQSATVRALGRTGRRLWPSRSAEFAPSKARVARTNGPR